MTALEKSLQVFVGKGLGPGRFQTINLRNEHRYATTASLCTCPDFTYRRRACGHIEAVKDHLADLKGEIRI
jgi:predicted nucleic acid-binding Zn finger protein